LKPFDTSLAGICGNPARILAKCKHSITQTPQVMSNEHAAPFSPALA
jgi:hypothetical protein